MASDRESRRLAAIMATDVVGYSRLMGADEAGTRLALRAMRADLWDPKIAEHGGRVVNTTGDGQLIEFASVVGAVECAVDMQRAVARRNADIAEDRRIILRIGVNLGDIIAEGDDIHGDGVNVASRLEGLAEPGGICISRKVREEIRDKLPYVLDDMGEVEVKNIARPVHAFRVRLDEPPAALGEAPPLPDKPSIAVLPFANMSDDPAQEYFADGIAEDVITALSHFHSLFVIARNSTFTYKGRAVDIAQVARELGVRYVVEGSVRKAGNRVRITAQLIDGTSGNHLWAEHFDGSLDDVFDLQDQITERIVVVVEPEIQTRERERVGRKPPESLDAWELVQRGLSHFYRANRTDQAEAIRLFREAAALDSKFAAPHAHLAYAFWVSTMFGYAEDRAKALASMRSAAERALSLDPNEPMAHFASGRVLIDSGEIEMGIGEMQTAIAINPNFAMGYYGLGLAYHFGAGQAEQALPHYAAALRLNPRDPWRWVTLMQKGSVLRTLGRHDEAIAFCRQACQFPDTSYQPRMHLAASLAEAGQKSEAHASVKKAMQLQPALSISFMRSRYVGTHEIFLKSLLDSLRKAGVPE